jgi:hypothetical protein
MEPAVVKRRRLQETLLFPSLGTTDLKIPAAVAAGALTASLSKLGAPYPLALTLCDDAAAISSSILTQLDLASGCGGRFAVHAVTTLGDLSCVLSVRPAVLVVECNWRFAPNANKLSAALHRFLLQHHGHHPSSSSSSSSLPGDDDAPTALRAGALAGGADQVALVGVAYPVAVPEACALASVYGVRHVIYARPPNLNPARPDCLAGMAKALLVEPRRVA